MNLKKHLVMILICFISWCMFFLLGIPSNYYLDYSVFVKMLIAIGTFVVFIPLLTVMLLRTFKNIYLFEASLYFTIYATLGIFILDYIYCGIYLGHGLDFIKSHWLQSLFYVLLWLEIPIIGYMMKKRRLTKRAKAFYYERYGSHYNS